MQLQITAHPVTRLKRRCSLIGGLLLLLSSSVHATLINGDFSPGFDGWLASIDSLVDGYSDDLDPDAYPNFAIAGSGLATLETSTATNDIWSVGLYQSFSLAALAPGASWWLSYDLDIALSDNSLFGDLALAQFSNSTYTQVLDLRGQSMVDVSAFAGQQVELFFGLDDYDDQADTMQVGNISLTQTPPSPVPLPAPLVLFPSGLLGLVWLARRQRQR